MQGTIGLIRLLPDQPIGQRLFTAVVLITISIGLFIYFRNNIPQRFAKWVTGRLVGDAEKIHYFVYLPYWIVSIIAYAFASIFASALAFAVVGAGAVASAVNFFVAISVTFFMAVTFVGAFAAAEIFAVAFAIFFISFFALSTSTGGVAGAFIGAVAVLVFLLPLANAALDMISWGITRTLLSKIDHDSDGVRGLALVISALTLDIVVAIGCLVGLVALIASLLEASNLFYASFDIQEFDWKSQIVLARASPFSEGLFVTGMLATTLVPTVVHLTLGIGHAMTVWSPSAQETSVLIHDSMPTSAKQAVARVMLYRKLWMLPAFVMVCLIGWGLFAAFSAWIAPFGLFLEQVAFASAALIAEP
ncbi:hypothetical protein [uncultured Roseibium sp.]|uniref:hypothetical protein n=1 Tax=uncultured Roseibium sp. TaxID=1936171 RepID=UPI003216B27D